MMVQIWIRSCFHLCAKAKVLTRASLPHPRYLTVPVLLIHSLPVTDHQAFCSSLNTPCVWSWGSKRRGSLCPVSSQSISKPLLKSYLLHVALSTLHSLKEYQTLLLCSIFFNRICVSFVIVCNSFVMFIVYCLPSLPFPSLLDRDCCLLCSLVYPKHPGQCPADCVWSMTICWINEWMDLGLRYVTLL